MLWYHDHALGITRLNVYAGLAGFFALRDDDDTGKPDNPLGLPADPYELGYAVQDRMFKSNGELFYPAFPGDPAYEGFIIDEGVRVCDATVGPPCLDPSQPTALAEFFGDHIVVNGKIWPKASVEPRQYRVRLLNGSDSRFMRLRLRLASSSIATEIGFADPVLPFFVIGSDQGLRENAVQVNEVDFLPGERLDLVIDFKGLGGVTVMPGSRVIVENILGDSPFNGDPLDADFFENRRTDRIMAFDVDMTKDVTRPDTYIMQGTPLYGGVDVPATTVTRKLALFEGSDEFGRLMPMMGPAEPTADVNGTIVNGAMTFSQPYTENPDLNGTEVWEIYNATGDAHPIHVHLVHFQVINREGFTADLIQQDVITPMGTVTNGGYRLENITLDGITRLPDATEGNRRDMVMALPGEVTRISMTFDKPGRYVWHCHILSHEDHEMMRPIYVGRPTPVA